MLSLARPCILRRVWPVGSVVVLKELFALSPISQSRIERFLAILGRHFHALYLYSPQFMRAVDVLARALGKSI